MIDCHSIEVEQEQKNYWLDSVIQICSMSSFPNVSGLALHKWSCKYVRILARLAYAMKEKINTQIDFVVWRSSACDIEEMEVVV